MGLGTRVGEGGEWGWGLRDFSADGMGGEGVWGVGRIIGRGLGAWLWGGMAIGWKNLVNGDQVFKWQRLDNLLSIT